MAYIDIQTIKDNLGSIDPTKINDTLIENSISEATRIINQNTNTKVIREKIQYIDEVRDNDIDGENKTYYIKNWKNKYLGDTNDDGEITTADLKVYSVDSDNVETQLTISSINYEDNSFTLETAPEDVDLYVTYAYSYFDMDTPDKLITLLAKYLSLSECYFLIENDLVGTSAKMGNMSVSGLDKSSKTIKNKQRADALLSELKAFGTSNVLPIPFEVAKWTFEQ